MPDGVSKRHVDVLAVVLNWNGGAQTRTCIDHLLRQRDVPLTILVVDNASTDDSAAGLEDASVPVIVHKLAANLGFAGGMNVGLERALRDQYRYVWLVNNDAFAAPDCLKLLRDAMERDDSTVLMSPRLRSSDGTEQHTGGILNWFDGAQNFLSADELADDASRVDGRWITGAAPLIRTSALQCVGLFHPDYFAYWEDIDLSIRLTRAGGHIGVVRDAEALHLGGATSGGATSPLVSFLDTRNRWLCLERQAVVGSARVRWWRFMAARLGQVGSYQVFGKHDLADAVVSGVSAARHGRYGRPDKPLRPAGWQDRAMARSPWRTSAALARIADWSEPSGRLRKAE